MGYKRLLALVLLLGVALGGCDPTTDMPGPKATVGGLGDVAAGGLLAAAAGGGGAGIAAGVISVGWSAAPLGTA
jgi:hypothetical protein